MTDSKGSCLCGAVKYTVDGEFDSFYLCHCTYCQKDTGAAHAANLFSREAILTWVSGEDDITTYHLPETRHCKSFCKHCGSSLPTYEVPGVLLVPVGSLDTQITLKPTARIFMASRANARCSPWNASATAANPCSAIPALPAPMRTRRRCWR
ncbi:MAG: aldehyde-activating protein [Oceanobacter sp.]|nr:MAG: aldehyde-activating protein [Oceanobacter sp.]